MNDLNLVVLQGYMTDDAKMHAIDDDKVVAEFSIAVHESWKKDEKTQESTSFFEIKAWNRLSDVVLEYGQKGRKVLLKGSLKQASWEDKKTGQKRSRVYVVADSLSFDLPRKENQPTETTTASS